MISRTKKNHEQEKAKSGDKAAEEAERENELYPKIKSSCKWYDLYTNENFDKAIEFD